jgi:MFS family permease
VKLFEIGAMSLAAWGFYAHHATLLLVVLFLMGLHSTVFGPIKYSILPQALKPEELTGGNGLVETGTALSILFGMMLGGSLMLSGNGPLAASIAILAIALNLAIFSFFPPVGLILPFVVTPAVCMFIGIYGSFPVIHEYLIKPLGEDDPPEDDDYDEDEITET